LEVFDQQQRDWERQRVNSSKKLERLVKQSVLNSCEDFRKKREENQLLDQLSDLREKFGDERGWKISLRLDQSKKGLIEYEEACGTKHYGLSYII